MNALEIIGVWFENLPSELQAELSDVLSAMLPEFLTCGGNASSFDDGNSLLGRALMRRPGANAVLVTGRATALAAAIDFIFLHRSTEEEWAVYQQYIEEYRNEALAGEREATAAILQSLIDEIPRRRALWIRESQKWRALRAAEAPTVGPLCSEQKHRD